MTTPPPEGADPAQPEPVSLDKPDETPADFDPYRFGAPEHPVPAEYAPPGYRPPTPPPTQPSPGEPPQYPQPSQAEPPQYAQAPQFPPSYGLPQQPPPYGQSQYPPVAPSYAHQYPQPRTGNGKAIAALVLGIVSIVLCWLSIVDLIPIVLAIIFGILARKEAKRSPQSGGHSLAVAGLVCAIVGAILATALTVYAYNRIKPCLQQYDRGSSAYNHCIKEKI